MSRIVTFYSYKGGVGRTFALANVAVLLAKKGKRVLLMDWDLEAPGLHRYFKSHILRASQSTEGLVHLLTTADTDSAASWRSYLTEVEINDCAPIHLVTSGDQAPDYVERVRSFSWNTFFENQAGGDLLNRWRNEWKAAYDFVLIDSRTGITDTGGVCTIYLPDILVLVFSANEQSFERGLHVAMGVQKARRDLAVPRPPLAVLPLPGRFDGRDEIDEAQYWLDRFAKELKPFYDDWMPSGLKPRQILELTKIPYITKFSFGEPLPVISQGVSDPEFPGFYLENVARLLVSDFQDAQYIVSPEGVDRAGSIAELRSLIAAVPLDEHAIARALNSIGRELGESTRLSELLTEVGVSFLRQKRFDSAEPYLRRAVALNADLLGATPITARASMNYLAELLMTTGRLDEAELIYRQILEIESDSEIEIPERVATYTNLASACRQMGRLDESLGLYRRAIELAETLGRPDDPTVLSLYSNLAGIYREMGQSDEAIRWYERALQMAEASGRSSDPAVLAAYNNLAGVHREMGRRDQAIRWYERALRMAEMTGRAGGSAVLATYNNLAGVYRETGRYEDAIRWYERAIEIVERTGRSGVLAALNTYNNLAEVFRETGRQSDAIGCYERVLRIAEATRRRGDPIIIKVYNNLAATYREMGNRDHAIRYYEQALQTVEETGGSGKGAALSTYNDLADLHLEMGHSQDAIRWYERAIDVAERVFGPESARTASQINKLADLLIEQRRFGEAESLLRRALNNLQSSVQDDSPIAARTRGSLARLLKAIGRIGEADEVADKSRFDVFISYDAHDRATVRLLAESLTERGIRVWFDQWELRPGDPISRALSAAVNSATAFIVCIGESGQGPWFQHELQVSLQRRDEHKQLIIPVLLPGGRFDLVPDTLRQFQLLDLSGGLTPTGLNSLSSAILRRNWRHH